MRQGQSDRERIRLHTPAVIAPCRKWTLRAPPADTVRAMSDGDSGYWPLRLPRNLTLPATDLFYNVEVAARRFPDKPFLVYYDTRISFARFKDESERLAGWLEQAGVRKGDRVLLMLQNSPQFALAFYAILRANAVAVPINPMSLTADLRHIASDSGARLAITAQELLPIMQPLLGDGLDRILLATYSDYLEEATDLSVPAFVSAVRNVAAAAGITPWREALATRAPPPTASVGPGDYCALIYTSGTTGRPKGCIHTHRGAMHTAVAGMQWFGVQQDDVQLAVLPLFHVSGLQFCLNGPLYTGSTVVLLSRWDRDATAACIQRQRVTFWTTIPTMVVDFFGNPSLDNHDLSSLGWMMGGGAAMPAPIAQNLAERHIPYFEGYGLTETMGPTHLNPTERAKPQCLGIPIFGTEAKVVDPVTLQSLPRGEPGEILIRGPQVFTGYWGSATDTADAFVTIGGEQWLRTGDLGRVDEDGYYFMVDRLKRMINAAGLKVWPAEVESLMYQHPAIHEACVIAAKDVRRGETVKAVVSLRAGYRGKVTEQEIMDWARTVMAAYKVPRIIQISDQLPKSASGKIAWRQLQEKEAAG
jgi:fatty-acyl-CoA synthase